MVSTPFGIPLVMMPFMLPLMPVILPLWAYYRLIFGGDEPMKPERLATLTSSMCCLMLLSYAASKSPIRTPPIMLATCIMSILCSCSSSVIANDTKKRLEKALKGEEAKK